MLIYLIVYINKVFFKNIIYLIYNYYKKLRKKTSTMFVNYISKYPIHYGWKKYTILYKFHNFPNLKKIIGYAEILFDNDNM